MPAYGALTVTALCELAGVSRTTLYRYHPGVLRELHEWKRKRCRKAVPSRRIVRELREESAELRTQIGQLAALVDHYFAVWSESQVLLRRHENELAALRRQIGPKVTTIRLDSISGSGE